MEFPFADYGDVCYYNCVFNKIKIRVDKELSDFVHNEEMLRLIRKTSPLLFKTIKEFILREGKRIRPILFIIGYSGFKKRVPENLYSCAISAELLHDFLLIHDDIIDKSPLRRGKPSMHISFNKYLSQYRGLKFSGTDLSIVTADIIYALSIKSFLSIKSDKRREEKALKKFIEAAVNTGMGEFIELTDGIKAISKIKKRDIYTIYDYKTAYYTFYIPLSAGAILAGAEDEEIRKLKDFAISMGRAFQIKDDYLGIFGDEDKIGKSTLSDLQESKKTLFIWYAYNKGPAKHRKLIEEMFHKKHITYNNLKTIQKVIIESGALRFAIREISILTNKAKKALETSSINSIHKKYLFSFLEKTLAINGINEKV